MGEGADTQAARTAVDYCSDSIVRLQYGDLALVDCPAMFSDWHRTICCRYAVTERNDVCDCLYLDSDSTSVCVRSTRPNHGGTAARGFGDQPGKRTTKLAAHRELH